MSGRGWTRGRERAAAGRMRALLSLPIAALAACAPRPGPAAPLEAGAPRPEGAPEQAVELGRVHWERDHDAAFARAARESKPVLLLFQEVPG